MKWYKTIRYHSMDEDCHWNNLIIFEYRFGIWIGDKTYESTLLDLLIQSLIEFILTQFFRKHHAQNFANTLLLFIVQSLSHVRLSANLWTAAPKLPVLHYLPEFAQTCVHWVSYTIQTFQPVVYTANVEINKIVQSILLWCVNSIRQKSNIQT